MTEDEWLTENNPRPLLRKRGNFSERQLLLFGCACCRSQWHLFVPAHCQEVVLTAEEQAFLDGPTHELCGMINDWQIRHAEREVPEAVWDFVKKHGFLGMLISKAHGGLGFSAQAQSLILGKIASRSPDAVTIVMVPNSLGPGELIEKYGTGLE